MKQRQSLPQKVAGSRARQALGFGPIQVNDKSDTCGLSLFSVKNADTSGFDKAQQGVRRICDHTSRRHSKTCPIIRDKVCAARQQLQRERRLAAARCSAYQNRLLSKCRATCVQNVMGVRRSDGRRHRRSDWQTHDKAGTQRLRGDVCFGGSNVFRPDHTAMRFDNLLGNRQAQT